MTFEDWFQLRLDSLRRQNEWRKIDCLLASKEYVRDAWEVNAAPIEQLTTLETDAHLIFNNPPGETPQIARDVIEWYAGSIRVVLDSAAPKETK